MTPRASSRLREALENLLRNLAFTLFGPEYNDADGRQTAMSTIAAAPPGALFAIISLVLHGRIWVGSFCSLQQEYPSPCRMNGDGAPKNGPEYACYSENR